MYFIGLTHIRQEKNLSEVVKVVFRIKRIGRNCKTANFLLENNYELIVHIKF